MNEFYCNSMTYNINGVFQLSDDHEEVEFEYPTETTYVQCQTCKHYVHPSHGVIDVNINEFFCDECETEYQKQQQ